MKALVNKGIIILFCFSSLFFKPIGIQEVMIILVCVTISALSTYFDAKFSRTLLLGAYTVCSFLVPSFIYFLPLFLYDLFLTKDYWQYLVALGPIFLNINYFIPWELLILFTSTLLGFILKWHSETVSDLILEQRRLRDKAKEQSINLESKNRALLERQDYEIHVATLNERNRIAREIHDNVGHLLSRSLLQLGALEVVNSDEKVAEGLNQLNNSLTEAMNSIRHSVHNLHDRSIELDTEILALGDHFKFCPLNIDLELSSDPDKGIKYAVIAIVKEGLSNIMRHSNGSAAKISLREHPGLYQLKIEDNGVVKEKKKEGLGLKNIEDRVNALGGIFNISQENGFSIFISIPKNKKGRDKHENYNY